MGEYLHPRMMLRPGDVARRHEASWRGLTAESVQFTATEGFEYEFRAPCHLLIAADRGIRIKGETRVEGVVASSRRDIGRTLSFIPKGYLFRGSFLPRVLPRTGYLYVDPAMPLADAEIGFADMEFEPPYPTVDDRVDYGEVRYRAIGRIDRVLHFLAFTYRDGVLRPISLRRANRTEAKRHASR